MGALISVIISVLLMLTGCESTPKQAQSGELSVHFIDVGQGDCTLVMMPDGKNMLIDAGNKENSDDITDYLSANGVKKIDYAVATHPHAEVLTALKQVGADVLRTDLLGSIVITSDGDKVTVQNKYEPQNANAPPEDTDTDYVYITNSGKKYHRENCARLAKSKIKITRQDAQSRGLAPCKVCEP